MSKTERTYEVVAIERFLVRTTYHVQAGSMQEAENIVKRGDASYDDHEMLDDPGNFIRIKSVKALSHAPYKRVADGHNPDAGDKGGDDAPI